MSAIEFNKAFEAETLAITKRLCVGTKYYLRPHRGDFQLFDNKVFVCRVIADSIREIRSAMLQNPHLVEIVQEERSVQDR
jgi:hypothetical protein